jgi:hypothetical protein
MLDADWISLASWAAFRIGFLCKNSNLNNILVVLSLFLFFNGIEGFFYIYNYVHSSVKGYILCSIVSFAYKLFNFGE